MKSRNHGVGLIGCGAIGSELARALENGTVPGAEILAIFDQDRTGVERLSNDLHNGVKAADSVNDLLETEHLTLVIEAASQSALKQNGIAVVSTGRDLLAMSTGALLCPTFFLELSAAAESSGSRIFVPSGAVGGIDAIRAAKRGLHEVILTTRKHPSTIVDTSSSDKTPMDGVTYATVIFDGSAIEAVRRFPFNINVAATISLAGIGPERTRVVVIADPEAKGNNHEVYASGDSGVMRFTMENIPHPDNPKTSYLAVLSALETLRTACDGSLRVGA